MSERRDRMALQIKNHCKEKKQGDLISILEALEQSYPGYNLVAVHGPSDRLVFGEEYVGEQYDKVCLEEARDAVSGL